jgi:CubicO group peptidase (beta-lactamase class C family)/pimeloyl-ACP methyl ester carboxylesterase
MAAIHQAKESFKNIYGESCSNYRIMKKLFLLHLVLLSSFVQAQRIDTIKVKVHDHVLTLYSSGAGSPAVILEAGGASNHKTWDSVQHKIAKFTRVISYDRPGYLNSDSCSKQRDAITIAKELKEALTKAGINPPYVLGGWSMGGAFVRVFAGLYPKDVAGLVLVDPTPEESYARFEKEHPEIWKEEDKYLEQMLNSKHAGVRDEMRMYDSSMNQARRSDAQHNTPTYLLIAAGKAPSGQDRDPSDPLNKIWIEELEKWAKKRPNLQYDIITNSGHHIARFQPDTVVHAIRKRVQQYQSQKLKQSATPYKKPLQLNDGIQTATLKEVGIDEKIIRAMTDSITNGNYPNIHSVLILRNNKLVYEQYFPGTDVTRGVGFVGFKNHHRDSLHDIRSITKSIVGAAVLLAHAKGHIKSLNQKIFEFFPEHAKYDTGIKRHITVQHLLNMTPGLEWNEEISYLDPKNSEIMMNDAANAVEFVLSRKMVNYPGSNYTYSGGCTQVLTAIVEKATGMRVDKFVEQQLFKPLGIEKYSWVKTRSGELSAASGLRMRSRDLAKFGLLFMNDGKWQNKEIIPMHLVAQTINSQAVTHDADSIVLFAGYSNQFWIYTENIKGKLADFVQCQGNGGQIILMDKKHDLVLVVTAGNYNNRTLRKSSYDIFPDFIYPSVNGDAGKDSVSELIQQLTYKAISSEFVLDTAFIANLMDEDFISIYPHKTQNKQQELAGIYRSEINRRKEDHFIDSLYLDDFKVQVFDNTVVATYYSVTKGKKKGVPFNNYRMRWYDVWVKRNGEWKWISSQGTTITDR